MSKCMYPQVARKHLKPLLDALTETKYMSTNSAKQHSLLDYFLVIYCVIIVENK